MKSLTSIFSPVFKLSTIVVFLQKAERKWEEKRQNLEHYNGKEFEKLLEEAQANIMKSIPNLEMPPASSPVPKGGDAVTDKPELSGEGQPSAGLVDMRVLTVLNAESVPAEIPWDKRAMSYFLMGLPGSADKVTGHQTW